jgi:hypothetical protein
MVSKRTTDAHDQRIAGMTFASVYPMYLAKVEKKGRTQQELNEVIRWLTGFDGKRLQAMIQSEATFESFFGEAQYSPPVR